MFWQKMMKKKYAPNGTTTGKNLFGKAMLEWNKMVEARLAARTRTSNPKDKVGKLEEIWTNFRRFEDGNRKFFFRKFEKKAFDNAEGFIKALERRGFKRLGSGVFSTVLAKDGQKRVIKVVRRPDGWINYVHWAAQIGEAGHFAPKVFSYKKIKGRVTDFSVAVMERLEYTLSDAPEEHALKILPDLLYRAEKNDMAQSFADVLAPGLMDFMKKMGEQWKIPIQNFDLHGGNLMVRANGGFVVVDPVSRGKDEFLRLREGDFAPLPLLILVTYDRFLIENSYRHRGEWTSQPRQNLGDCL